jgi:hypothetical protein
MHAAEFGAVMQRREHLAGIEQPLLVEGAFDALLMLHVDLGEHHRFHGFIKPPFGSYSRNRGQPFKNIFKFIFGRVLNRTTPFARTRPTCDILSAMKTKTLELAMEKAATLPAEVQEQIGRDVLERVDQVARLRAELEMGIRQLDAGLGEPLDIEELIATAQPNMAAKGSIDLWSPAAKLDLRDIWARFADIASTDTADSLLREGRPRRNGERIKVSSGGREGIFRSPRRRWRAA